MEDNVLTPMELFNTTYDNMYNKEGTFWTEEARKTEWLECISYSLAVIAEKLQ